MTTGWAAAFIAELTSVIANPPAINADNIARNFLTIRHKSGPRIDLAEELINHIRLLFAESKTCPIELKTAGPILYLNNVTIEAFPLHHLDAMRGYTDVAFILVDEGEFFIPSQQEGCRMVVEGYRLKTKPNRTVLHNSFEFDNFYIFCFCVFFILKEMDELHILDLFLSSAFQQMSHCFEFLQFCQCAQ
jgi:hypothetical protein